MTRTLINLFIFSICLLQGKSYGQQITDVDVCVYGGSSAGVIAAYTAKMHGKSVILIEPGKHLGGLTTGGLGYTDIGNKYAVSGISRDFYRKIGKHYGRFEQWIFEPHVAEDIFKEYVKKSSLDVLYDYRLTIVKKEGLNIREITIEQSSDPQSTSNKTIRAKIFMDCTYEGDLMAKAGVSYKVGREANADYHETYNGVQLRDKHQFLDGIDPYKIPGNPSSGLLWGISPEVLSVQGSGDSKVQTYNFRVCLTSDPANAIPITQPDGYDSTRYELLIRMLQKEPNRPFNMIMKPDMMPNNKTDINNNGPFSTDMIGMNYNYPEAGYAERARITKEHENYVKGFLYFIGHSRRMPERFRSEMLRLGYPRDEYQDNHNWSPQMYVREARRMIGAYVMTQANCEGKERVEDAVGMAAYTMDSHNTSRIVINGMVKNEGDVQIGGFPPYPIAYRSLIPKASECTNLYVPICLSATHIAYGSIRMEPVFMVLAQSSAVAAVQAIDRMISVQDVDVKAVQAAIQKDPLADHSIAEILIDNDDASVTKTGNWQKEGKGSYGPSLFKSADASSVVSFKPKIVTMSDYDVYFYLPKIDGLAKEIPVTVRLGDTKKHITIKTQELRVEGQTSGEWVHLGKFPFQTGDRQSVEVSGSKGGGFVVGDAVLLVPSK
ncbi:MAG: FAD-dependent oxidoreductase [Chryseolinea sp.]